MNCPKCNITLLMADRQGVEIDYCPTCRGIWLDRGELEKLIDRSAETYPPAGRQGGIPYSDFSSNHHDKYFDHDDHHQHGSHEQYSRRRKKGFLGDLFDF